MLEYYRRDQSSESFQVQTCRSSDIANVLRDHFASAELLLTFASNQCDEQALARDIHRAAPSPEAAKKQILRLPVYNMYRACERLKQAHDRLTAMASTQQPSTSANAAREKKQKPYTLDAMHEHFVLSTGRRFVTPLPEGMLQFDAPCLHTIAVTAVALSGIYCVHNDRHAYTSASCCG